MAARDFPVTGGWITLGQALKRLGYVETGGQAKAWLAASAGQVLVNGQPETRRGRKLRPGDTFTVAGETFHCTEGSPAQEAGNSFPPVNVPGRSPVEGF